MAIGDRRTAVLVERYKRGQSPNQGGHVDESDPASWEVAVDVGDKGMLFVAVKATGSREFQRGAQVVTARTHMVEADYMCAQKVTAGMRLRLGERILNIDGPPMNVDERNRLLQCECLEEP